MSIRDMANDFWLGNATMRSIYDAQQLEIDKIYEEIEKIFKDNFIVLASVDGVSNFEKILGIVPDTLLESLELRRARVINRLSRRTSLTRLSLRELLTKAFGVENFNLVIDNSIHTIFLDVTTAVKGLYQQTMDDVAEMIPANMILYTKQIIDIDVEKSQAVAVTYVQTSKKFVSTPIVRKEV